MPQCSICVVLLALRADVGLAGACNRRMIDEASAYSGQDSLTHSRGACCQSIHGPLDSF